MSAGSGNIEKIGKYQIVKTLGTGATSTVYLANDAFNSRQVAVKVVYPEVLRDKEHGKRYRNLFLTEASLAGKLIHPHIVAIYDAIVDEDSSYIVMEYVAGGTLERYVTPETLLPIDTVVGIIFKCCRALDFASRNGVIHRDIKPANILRSDEANIKISDFGAALTTHTEHTQVTGIGSPAYMSPQQIKEQQLNHQTDIYSLGVMMYHLLTGKLPFHGANYYSVIYQIANTDPPVPSSLRPDLPPALDKIITSAMQKELSKRYQTWEEFGGELAHAFTHLGQMREDFSDTEKFNILRKLSFFNTFTEIELWEVLRISSWKKVPANTVVIKEGDIGRSFYILADGEVKITQRNRLLNVLSKGDCFGEMGYLHHRESERSASVTTTKETVLLKIKAAALEQSSAPCIARFNQVFLNILVERLHTSNTRISSTV